MRMIRWIPVSLVALCLMGFVVGATQAGRRGRPVEATMLNAAKGFLAALTNDQLAKAKFPFNDAERLNWYYVPIARKGLPVKEMNSAQQGVALTLLRAGLSQKGYDKVATIRSLENVLKVIEAGKGPTRDPELYFITIFGEPSESGSRGWGLEGSDTS